MAAGPGAGAHRTSPGVLHHRRRFTVELRSAV